MKNGDVLTINGIDYLLEAPIDSGIGSYGRVWAATEIGHGRVVAIKVVNTERMNQIDSSYHRRWSESMEREIAFLEGLQGKAARHIVTLYNHGDCEGQPALVLERMHANLGQWLQSLPSAERAIPLHQLLKWTQQILAGLTVVHDADFIYRDLKFSNVLVNQNGQLLKLADFGTLKHYDGDGTYSYAGTPNTMAPEQALPASYDENQPRYAVEPPQTDYYALGLLLFGLLTGQKSIRAQLEMDSLKQRLGLERANLWDYLVKGRKYVRTVWEVSRE